MNPRDVIENGASILGVELGSTRIKASLIAPDAAPLAEGSVGWENQLVDGVWTYALEDVLSGIAACVADLRTNVGNSHGATLTGVAALGVSGMMHGYVALDENDDLLVPFRTWRNNITGEAASSLTEVLNSPIAQRWSIAHLYQAILNGEPHVGRIRHLTTIASYLHYRLTGVWAIGLCEASGMFPVDPGTGTYAAEGVQAFDSLVAEHGFPWQLLDILPGVIAPGESAGSLTEAGAQLLDPTGGLAPGAPCCAPEGDAGTGMVATNAIRPRTGNVSAGTSVFAMLVLERPLSRVHEEIDLVLTPHGAPVAMAHSNNCTSDLDAWMGLLGEAAAALGTSVSTNDLYGTLLPLALQGAKDADGFLAYGYVSGEHITGFSEGRPLFARRPDKPLSLASFIRVHMMTALGALRSGLNILTKEEGVQVDEIVGHGGFFKTPVVGQSLMAAATKTPISVMETAGEGGAWGMALLAAYLVREKRAASLEEFLASIFASARKETIVPHPDDMEGFERFHDRYRAGLAVEQAAVESIRVSES